MIIVFQYEARPEQVPRFEQVYGPDGEWARFFQADAGYLGTDLHRSSEHPGGYVVIDRWIAPEAYERFLERNRQAYDRRRDAAQDLYQRGTLLGRFDPAPPATALTLEILSGEYAACRLDASAPVPGWARGDDAFLAVTRTHQELSIVCPARRIPADVDAERRWRCMRVAGPLDFAVTGVAAALTAPLAAAGIPLLLIATYDTDYLLVREHDVQRAFAALSAAGHRLRPV